VILAMMKPVSGVSRSNPLNGYLQGFFQGILDAGLRLMQRSFKLALGLLDRRKVGGSKGAETAPVLHMPPAILAGPSGEIRVGYLGGVYS
jgi:hypothetical protein